MFFGILKVEDSVSEVEGVYIDPPMPGKNFILTHLDGGATVVEVANKSMHRFGPLLKFKCADGLDYQLISDVECSNENNSRRLRDVSF